VDSDIRGGETFASLEVSGFGTHPQVSTPTIASAAKRLSVAVRFAPPNLRPIRPQTQLFGCVVPVRYFGTAEVILEAIERSGPGDVLVIDNKGRTQEACIDYLTALEALSAGMAGAIVWGAHRDTEALGALDFPVFSCGSFPGGPNQARTTPPDALTFARVGTRVATRDDVVFADLDGIVFIPLARLGEVLDTARAISSNERRQTAGVIAGTSLREQFGFQDYLARRTTDPTYTLAQHLRGGRRPGRSLA
jgi:4-hydroxy-4-methyl-2-oxoglutarate aldolase